MVHDNLLARHRPLPEKTGRRSLQRHFSVLLSLLPLLCLSIPTAALSATDEESMLAQDNALPQDDALTDRVASRWKSLISGRFDEAYALELPTYQAIFDANAFRAGFSRTSSWGGFEIVRADVPEPDRAIVELNVTYPVKLGSGSSETTTVSTVKETWLNRSGQWWHVPTLGESGLRSGDSSTDAPDSGKMSVNRAEMPSLAR